MPWMRHLRAGRMRVFLPAGRVCFGLDVALPSNDMDLTQVQFVSGDVTRAMRHRSAGRPTCGATWRK